MTLEQQVKRLKRQLEKSNADRDRTLQKFGQAGAKLNDNAKQITYLQRQQQALVALSNGYGLLGTDHDTMWSHVTELDRIINTPNLLKKITGCTPGQFAFKQRLLEPLAMEYGPLFRGGGSRAGDPGNRCKLYPRHVLLLALIRYYTEMAESALQPWFGVLGQTRGIKRMAGFLPQGRVVGLTVQPLPADAGDQRQIRSPPMIDKI